MSAAAPDQSSEPITHARLLRIALPIVAANVTVPLLGLVDTAVVGRLGDAAPIGAVGVGAAILSSVFWIFGFLRMGTTGLVAQARGAGDMGESHAILKRGFVVAGIAGLALIALQIPIFMLAFQLAPASDAVEAMTRDYLAIRIWGAPATIAVYAVTGWLIAMERTRAVLVLQIVMNGLNIVLSIWFVMGLGWGVEGVAAATLMAEWLGLALGLWLCRSALTGVSARIMDAVQLKRMAAVNTDIMIRSILLVGSFTGFMFLSAGQGDVPLAANQVLLQFLTFLAFLLDGFAFAAEALVGQAYGARDRAALRRGVWLSSLWSALCAVALSVAFLVAGGAIIDALTTVPEVRESARLFLLWVVAAPILAMPSNILDGIFIGTTRTRAMRNGMIVSVAGYVLALWLTQPLGNHGLWLSMMILYILRALTLGVLYPRIPASLETAK